MPSVSAFQTAIDAVVTAIGTEDWAAAHKQLAVAEAQLAGIMISEQWTQQTRTKFKDNLKNVRDALKSAENYSTNGGIYEIHTEWELL